MAFFKCLDCQKVWTFLKDRGCNMCGSPCEVLDGNSLPPRYTKLSSESGPEHRKEDADDDHAVDDRDPGASNEDTKTTQDKINGMTETLRQLQRQRCPNAVEHLAADQLASVARDAPAPQPPPKWLPDDVFGKLEPRGTGAAVFDNGFQPLPVIQEEQDELDVTSKEPSRLWFVAAADGTIYLPGCALHPEAPAQEPMPPLAMPIHPSAKQSQADHEKWEAQSSRPFSHGTSTSTTFTPEDVVFDHEEAISIDERAQNKKADKERKKQKKQARKERKKAAEEDRGNITPTSKTPVQKPTTSTSPAFPPRKKSKTPVAAVLEKPEPLTPLTASQDGDQGWSQVVGRSNRGAFQHARVRKEVNKTMYAARKESDADENGEEDRDRDRDRPIVARMNVGGAKHDTVRVVPRWVVESGFE